MVGLMGDACYTYWSDELARWLQFVQIRSDLHHLWVAHRHEDRFFAQGAILLQTAAGNIQRDALRRDHVDLFLNLIHILSKDSLTSDDITRCYEELRENGLRVMIELDDEALRLYHEEL